ncbi:hypothetical protein LINPERHAP2_LOCUS1443 [Linum perenne]
MELIPTSWSRHWMRKNRYQRLNDAPLRRRNIRVARLGGGDKSSSSPGRLGWRIKVVPCEQRKSPINPAESSPFGPNPERGELRLIGKSELLRR